MQEPRFETGLPKTKAGWAWFGVRAVVVLAWFAAAWIGIAIGAAIVAVPEGHMPSNSVAVMILLGLLVIAFAFVLLTRLSSRDDEIGRGAEALRRWMLVMPFLAAMLAAYVALANHPPGGV